MVILLISYVNFTVFVVFFRLTTKQIYKKKRNHSKVYRAKQFDYTQFHFFSLTVSPQLCFCY